MKNNCHSSDTTLRWRLSFQMRERERERERERKRADKQLCYDVKKEGEGSNQEDPSFTNE